MKKKPKVFANVINKNIRNNKTVYDSANDDSIILERNDSLVIVGDANNSNNNENNVLDKIKELLDREGYIFNVEVLIKTSNKEYKTHIASIINNHIITLDNDIINIDDISDIKY